MASLEECKNSESPKLNRLSKTPLNHKPNKFSINDIATRLTSKTTQLKDTEETPLSIINEPSTTEMTTEVKTDDEPKDDVLKKLGRPKRQIKRGPMSKTMIQTEDENAVDGFKEVTKEEFVLPGPLSAQSSSDSNTEKLKNDEKTNDLEQSQISSSSDQIAKKIRRKKKTISGIIPQISKYVLLNFCFCNRIPKRK